MTSTLQRVGVFIASPSDVNAERDAARDSVERINRLVAKHNGFLLEPIGWEDVPPRQAIRSQEAINPYVEKARIFIGILNQRFGSSTGKADSGTEEEFNIAEDRWNRETPKPEIMLFFKNVLDDRLCDPGEQLQKVMAFRERVQSRTWFREFETTTSFQEKLESGLASWIYQQRDTDASVQPDYPRLINPADVSFLVVLATNGSTVREHEDRVTGLTGSGLLRQPRYGTSHELATSTDAFLSVTKHILSGGDFFKDICPYLASPYYMSILTDRLRSIIESRFHFQPDESALAFARKAASLSPRAASFLLFGDTTRYDNLSEQVRAISGDMQQHAGDSLSHDLILQMLNDMAGGTIANHLNGKELVATVLKVSIAGAHENSQAFAASAVWPSMLVRASGPIRAGEMVTGPPDVLIRFAVGLSHLGEYAESLDVLERARDLNPTPEVEAVIDNNKGHALFELGRLEDARACFDSALSVNPNMEQARRGRQKAELALTNSRAGHQHSDRLMTLISSTTRSWPNVPPGDPNMYDVVWHACQIRDAMQLRLPVELPTFDKGIELVECVERNFIAGGMLIRFSELPTRAARLISAIRHEDFLGFSDELNYVVSLFLWHGCIGMAKTLRHADSRGTSYTRQMRQSEYDALKTCWEKEEDKGNLWVEYGVSICRAFELSRGNSPVEEWVPSSSPYWQT